MKWLPRQRPEQWEKSGLFFHHLTTFFTAHTVLISSKLFNNFFSVQKMDQMLMYFSTFLRDVHGQYGPIFPLLDHCAVTRIFWIHNNWNERLTFNQRNFNLIHRTAFSTNWVLLTFKKSAEFSLAKKKQAQNGVAAMRRLAAGTPALCIQTIVASLATRVRLALSLHKNLRRRDPLLNFQFHSSAMSPKGRII